MRRQHLRNKPFTILENPLLIHAALKGRKKILLKTPILLLRRINLWVVTYLDDILTMGQTIKETVISKDSIIFHLQHLGFVLNWRGPL